VGEYSCHHLVFHQDAVDWQIWIDTGPVAVPRKILISYTAAPGRPEFSAVLDQWDLSPTVSPGQFEPKIPAGAKRVELSSLLEAE
jgi:hypothetical protein